MQAKTILYPTDFSEYSEAALEHAVSLARDMGAMVHIVHVKEPPGAFVDTGFGGYPIDVDEVELLNELEKVRPSDPKIGYTHKLLTGEPASEIVRYAKSQHVEMIVMGTHGRKGLTRMLMGSVAEEVVRKAPCPVLTIKQPAKEKVDTGS